MKPKTNKNLIMINRTNFLRMLERKSFHCPGSGYAVYTDQVRDCLSRAKVKE